MVLGREACPPAPPPGGSTGRGPGLLQRQRRRRSAYAALHRGALAMADGSPGFDMNDAAFNAWMRSAPEPNGASSAPGATPPMQQAAERGAVLAGSTVGSLATQLGLGATPEAGGAAPTPMAVSPPRIAGLGQRDTDQTAPMAGTELLPNDVDEPEGSAMGAASEDGTAPLADDAGAEDIEDIGEVSDLLSDLDEISQDELKIRILETTRAGESEECILTMWKHIEVGAGITLDMEPTLKAKKDKNKLRSGTFVRVGGPAEFTKADKILVKRPVLKVGCTQKYANPPILSRFGARHSGFAGLRGRFVTRG